MAYDASQLEEALERPSLTVRRGWAGRKIVRATNLVRRLLSLLPGVEITPKPVETKTYTGRLLSVHEMQPLQRRMRELERGDGNEEKWIEFFRDFMLHMDIPPSVVLGLPPKAMTEAINDFLACQMRAGGIEVSRVDLDAMVMGRQSPASGSPSGSRKTKRSRAS